MRTRRTIYYFLFLAIIMGAFASMAQNNYGLKIISWSCYLFSITFLIEFVLSRDKTTIAQKVEQLCMAVLLMLFGFRAAYIHFPYVEWVVVAVASILAVQYVRLGLQHRSLLSSKNGFMAQSVAAFYLSVSSFLVSILIRPINATVSQAMGGLGGLCLGLVVLAVLFRNKQLVDGEETSLLSYVRDREDHSSMLLTGFLMISIYVGLNFVGVLPTLYTNEVPGAYIELVNQAETGKEAPVDGTYQHDAYKQEWERFLARHGLDSKDN